MADIPQFSPGANDAIQALWFEVLARWQQGVYVYTGGKAQQLGSPGMSIAIDACTTPYGSTSGAAVSIDASDVSLDRIDTLYVTTGGAYAIWKGDNLAKVDPLGGSVWTQYTSPYPKAALPAGVPLYEIFVGHGVTSILNAALCPIAAKGISGGNTKVCGMEVIPVGTAFTLPYAPVANTYKLFKNGLRLFEGTGRGFTRSGTAVTLTTAAEIGDIYWNDFEY
jgi:hypothetical protein